MIDIQDVTNLDKVVRSIIGIELFREIESIKSVSEKVSILVDFMIDNYSFFFEQENRMEDLANDLDILTTIEDEDFSLTDEIVDSIMSINGLVEDDEDMLEEIATEIKTLLVYTLDVLTV